MVPWGQVTPSSNLEACGTTKRGGRSPPRILTGYWTDQSDPHGRNHQSKPCSVNRKPWAAKQDGVNIHQREAFSGLNGPVKTLAKSSLPKSHPVLGGITR